MSAQNDTDGAGAQSANPGAVESQGEAALRAEIAALRVRMVELERESQAAQRAKVAFLANMNHEIRAPLTSIIGHGALLSRRLEGDHRELARRIERGGQRLLETLNALLILAELEGNRMRVKLDVHNVVAEAQLVLKRLDQRARAKAIDLQLMASADPERLRASADRGALNHVIHHLVDNAVKFTPEGTVRVVVDDDQAAGRVRVQVEDTGIGIDPAYLPNLFVPFSQESSGLERSYDGCGIGLSITHRLVEKMHGTLEVVSEKGRGSVFTVSFPRVIEGEAGG